MNISRFTMFVALTAVGSLGLASACLDDLGALKPVDAGAPEAAAPVTACGDGIVATLDDGGDAGEACDPGPNAVSGCTAQCTISCGGMVGPSGHCYFLADPSDFATARENCARAGGHVVTIGSADEARLVESFADGGSYRVGMIVSSEEPAYVSTNSKDESIEPGWPRSNSRCTGCFAVLDASAGNEFPIGADGGDHLCLVTTARGWVQVPCSDDAVSYMTVCEREPPGQRAQYCGGPYCTTVPATTGRKRYVISLDPASATEADAFCRGYEGGKLLVLESREEREQLAREIEELLGDVPPPLREVWIGLARSSDGWRWADDAGAELGDAGRPLPWAKDEPKPDGAGRAYLRFNTRFDTQLAATSSGNQAEVKKRFVCQRSP